MTFRALALPAVAFAACGLPASVDPAGDCTLFEVGGKSYGNLDADSVADSNVTLTISKITESYLDHNGDNHSATVGDLVLNAADSRYELTCSQVDGEKTVMVSVTRPTDFGAELYFGAEWIQMYQKDSWSLDIAAETEPYTFNSYGSKVPLEEFRPDVDGLTDNSAVASSVLNVFQEVSSKGDFEFKYGNPNLLYGEGAAATWTALEFKSTLLRVGTPSDDCDGEVVGAQTVGSIVPAFYGHPNLERAAYDSIIDTLTAKVDDAFVVTMPVYVVLQIFASTSGSTDADGAVFTDNVDKWTSSTGFTDTYTKCFEAGNPCPENFNVCDATYCNVDQWNDIILKLKENPAVKVLGFVETDDAATMTADMASYTSTTPLDGFYFDGASEQGSLDLAKDACATVKTAGDLCVISTGVPLFDSTAYAGATAADVFVTLTADATDLAKWNPFAWFPYVASERWGAMLYNVADVATKTAEMFDRGYGFVYLSSAGSFSETSDTLASVLAAVQGGRRLQERQEARRLEETSATTQWACDDTLLACSPVCMKQQGFTTIQVSNNQCADAPMDPCSCPCLFEAEWACQGEKVVCMAKDTESLEMKVVGDLVCETRGAPKPKKEDFVLRQADECTPEPVPQGSYPTQQCMVQYQEAIDAKKTTAAPTPAPTMATPAPTTAAVDEVDGEGEAATPAPTTATEDEGATPAPTTATEEQTEEQAEATEAPVDLGTEVLSFSAPAAVLAVAAALA